VTMFLRAATLAGFVLGASYLWASRPAIHLVSEDAIPQGLDPPLLQDQERLSEAISRPVSVLDAEDIVLLVHGTGMT
jgi:hypothetical protein